MCLISATPCQARIIYVDANALGNDDGSSWEDSYNFLQDAILADATSGDQVWVAAGTYYPDQGGGRTPGDRTATFPLINGVAIKGGYAGVGGSDPNEHNIKLYETILSGDINTPDVNSGNSFHVVTGSGTDETAVLDGFTITGSNANGVGPQYDRGGGMYNNNSSPTVTNCTFIDNSADYGGGMWNIYDSNPTLTNCKFIGNSAVWGAAGINNYDSSPTLTNCKFIGNSTDQSGGGMANSGNSSIILQNCTFIDNSARSGGGIFNINLSDLITVINCTFIGNSAIYSGGGMWNYNSNVAVTNCTFIGNSAGRPGYYSGGGGMWNEYCSPTVTNCTFSNNSGQLGGGMFNLVGNPTVTNCILWYNSASVGSAIYNDGSSPIITYSNVQDTDPLFVDADGDYHLKPQVGRWDANSQSWVQDNVTSPCIDAGDPNSSIGWEPYPNGGRINMGAYGGTGEASKSYFGRPVCKKPIAGDVNGDCRVDFLDFRIMALHWLQDNNE